MLIKKETPEMEEGLGDKAISSLTATWAPRFILGFWNIFS